MAGSRRPLFLLLPFLAAGAALLAGSIPAMASGCSSSAYLTQLRQVRSELEAGAAVPAAVEQLQALASADRAAALTPVIDDLRSGDVAGAERLLGVTVATLRVSGGSGCGAETGAERQALSRVYQSPTFAHLDQPASPDWAQQVLKAIAGFVSGLVGTLGPLGAGALAALVLAVVVAVIGWRVRQVIASGREPRVDLGAAPAEADAEAEWTRALAASERGDFRQAVRHAFRSALISLVQRGRLPVQPAWTTPELLAHAGGDPELTAWLAPAAAGFDRAWYSRASVDADRWEELRGHCQAIRALPGRGRPS
jgi:hypothetical protein